MTLRGPATAELMQQLPERRYRDMLDDTTGVLTEEQRGGNTTVAVGDAYVQVYADLRTGVPEVRLTFSAPAVLRGHNAEPVSLSLLPEVAHAVWSVVTSEISGMPSYGDLRLTRLDLARDFVGVQSIPDTLWAISQLPVQRARKDVLARGANGTWQSLTRGNVGRWVAVSYDKGEELLDKANRQYDDARAAAYRAAAADAVQRQRWELQMRRPTLLTERVTGVELDEQRMFSMTEKYFQRTRFDTITGGSERLVRELDKLSQAEARGVVIVLVADLLGSAPWYGHNKAQDYRRLARSLGVSAADLVPETAEPRRLDFATGVQLVGDEAFGNPVEDVRRTA